MTTASAVPNDLVSQLKKMGSQLPQTAKNEINRILAPVATEGQLNGLSPKTLETIYSVAYSMYQAGQYKKARDIFQTLSLLDHFEYKYLFGLASCYQMEKEYEKAVETYGLCFILEPNDPSVPFYSGYCQMMLKNYEEAQSGFDAAIRWSGNCSEYRALKERAAAMLNLVKRKKECA